MNQTKNWMFDRRRALMLLGGAGASAILGQFGGSRAQAAGVCVDAAPTATEGPYWVEENLNRSDIRVDPSDGSVSAGLPLTLAINVEELTSSGCAPLAGAHVDIWHCDAGGIYSDEAANNSVGRKFLRGYQVTDDSGAVQFITVYPGWYSGRAVHIHVRVRTYSGSSVYDMFTSQFFFDDAITDLVHAQAPYSARGQRDTRNATDMVLTGMANSSRMFLNLTKTDQGYAATITIGVSLKTVAAARPAVSSNGVMSAASFLPGAAPGAWTAIVGQDLASTTRSLTTSDLVNGKIPTSLGGVSVTIDGQPAFVSYISPTQLNVQSPADSNAGAVQVTVTNAAGVSNAVTATLSPAAPAFFTSQSYIAAVRIDGTIVNSSTPARPGDELLLYGTAFGPTSPAVAPGVVFQGSAPTVDSVMLTVGGVPAQVSYAGLVGAGLYQLNAIVPALASGDYAVQAQISGLRSQDGVLLRVIQ